MEVQDNQAHRDLDFGPINSLRFNIAIFTMYIIRIAILLKLLAASFLLLQCEIPAPGVSVPGVIERAWQNAFDNEKNADTRFARFVGFIEGKFGIKTPNSWGEPMKFSPPQQSNQVVVDRLLHDDCRIVVRAIESQDELDIDLFDKSGALVWEGEPFSLFPRLMSGPANFTVAAEEDEVYIYLFGRLGDARFFQVRNKADGNVFKHFGFLLNRRSSLGNDVDSAK